MTLNMISSINETELDLYIIHLCERLCKEASKAESIFGGECYHGYLKVEPLIGTSFSAKKAYLSELIATLDKMDSKKMFGTYGWRQYVMTDNAPSLFILSSK